MRSATVEETEKQKKVKGRTEWTIECTTLDVFIEREVRLALESPMVCSAYNAFVRDTDSTCASANSVLARLI